MTNYVRAGWLTVVLAIAALPHVLEDFEFREPANHNVPVWAAIAALVVAYLLQILGAFLCFRGRPWGARLVVFTALTWVGGALIVHGPEIAAAGAAWRFGFTSIADVVLIVVIALVTAATGVAALRSR